MPGMTSDHFETSPEREIFRMTSSAKKKTNPLSKKKKKMGASQEDGASFEGRAFSHPTKTEGVAEGQSAATAVEQFSTVSVEAPENDATPVALFESFAVSAVAEYTVIPLAGATESYADATATSGAAVEGHTIFPLAESLPTSAPAAASASAPEGSHQEQSSDVRRAVFRLPRLRYSSGLTSSQKRVRNRHYGTQHLAQHVATRTPGFLRWYSVPAGILAVATIVGVISILVCSRNEAKKENSTSGGLPSNALAGVLFSVAAAVVIQELRLVAAVGAVIEACDAFALGDIVLKKQKRKSADFGSPVETWISCRTGGSGGNEKQLDHYEEEGEDDGAGGSHNTLEHQVKTISFGGDARQLLSVEDILGSPTRRDGRPGGGAVKLPSSFVVPLVLACISLLVAIALLVQPISSSSTVSLLHALLFGCLALPTAFSVRRLGTSQLSGIADARLAKLEVHLAALLDFNHSVLIERGKQASSIGIVDQSAQEGLQGQQASSIGIVDQSAQEVQHPVEVDLLDEICCRLHIPEADIVMERCMLSLRRSTHCCAVFHLLLRSGPVQLGPRRVWRYCGCDYGLDFWPLFTGESPFSRDVVQVRFSARGRSVILNSTIPASTSSSASSSTSLMLSLVPASVSLLLPSPARLHSVHSHSMNRCEHVPDAMVQVFFDSKEEWARARDVLRI
ncbi:unnamed protein product [Amoebophrya sp. A25]|nr:unnamed protein product [Amoebophrya sp. A25]|eukprot:GSA25T00015912001.1